MGLCIFEPRERGAADTRLRATPLTFGDTRPKDSSVIIAFFSNSIIVDWLERSIPPAIAPLAVIATQAVVISRRYFLSLFPRSVLFFIHATP